MLDPDVDTSSIFDSANNTALRRNQPLSDAGKFKTAFWSLEKPCYSGGAAGKGPDPPEPTPQVDDNERLGEHTSTQAAGVGTLSRRNSTKIILMTSDFDNDNRDVILDSSKNVSLIKMPIPDEYKERYLLPEEAFRLVDPANKPALGDGDTMGESGLSLEESYESLGSASLREGSSGVILPLPSTDEVEVEDSSTEEEEAVEQGVGSNKFTASQETAEIELMKNVSMHDASDIDPDFRHVLTDNEEPLSDSHSIGAIAAQSAEVKPVAAADEYEHEAFTATETAEVKTVAEADEYEHEAITATETAEVKPVAEADEYEHEAFTATETAEVKPVAEADEYENEGFTELIGAESSIVTASGRDVSAKESVEAVDDTIAEAALEAQELQDDIEEEVSATAQAIIEEESTGDRANTEVKMKLEGSAAEADNDDDYGDHLENEEEDHYADETFAHDGDAPTSTTEPVTAALSVKAVSTTNSVKNSSKSALPASSKAASSSASPRPTPSHKTGTGPTSGSTKKATTSPRANTHANTSSSESVSSVGGKGASATAAAGGMTSSYKASPRAVQTSASTKSTINSSVH